MEHLSSDKLADIKKMSTERVRQKLVGYGKSEEVLLLLEREVLLEELANEWLKEEMEESEGAVAQLEERKSDSGEEREERGERKGEFRGESWIRAEMEW